VLARALSRALLPPPQLRFGGRYFGALLFQHAHTDDLQSEGLGIVLPISGRATEDEEPRALGELPRLLAFFEDAALHVSDDVAQPHGGLFTHDEQHRWTLGEAGGEVGAESGGVAASAGEIDRIERPDLLLERAAATSARDDSVP
jgi:hypothetical protein